MAYTKTNWVDGSTPINAVNLNKIEQGISDVINPEGFIVPTFVNGAGGVGAPYDYPKYYKDAIGIVHLSGLVNASAGVIYFYLPEGYRPVHRLVYTVDSDGGSTRLDIDTNGAVIGLSAGYRSLCGITFRAGVD